MEPTYTSLLSQYLAFNHHYTILNGRAPAEADLKRLVQGTPPTVHAMIMKWDQKELISWVAGPARSIALMIAPESPPLLQRSDK